MDTVFAFQQPQVVFARCQRSRFLGSFGLKRKALVIFLIFVILPTFGVGVVVQIQFNEVLRDQFINSTKRNLDNVAGQLPRSLHLEQQSGV